MTEKRLVQIIEDWGDVLAVLKPAGWLTIPGRGNKENVPVLSHILGAQLREALGQAQKKSSTPDLYVVHRLDEGTSGVVLFARTADAHRQMSQAFESGAIKKTYWCFVKGSPERQTIDAPLFKLPSKKNKSVVSKEKGKPAQTIITPKATQDGITLVECTPLTGRSHQIRVHLAHIGFPILGDRLYAGEATACGITLSAPLLHARELEFSWPPNGSESKRRRATASLDGDFAKLAAALGFEPSCSV